MSGGKAARDQVDVSVVCVTYRSRDLVPAALRSAVDACAAAGLRPELIVVDNASDDGTVELVAATVPEAVIIGNTENLGFGRANNQAFAVAGGRWWLLLNPDATLEASALTALVHSLQADPRLAAVGPSVGGAGAGDAESAGMLPGLRSLAGHFLFINHLLPTDRGGAWRGFQVRPPRGTAPRPVDWISAAVVLMRPEAVHAVGGFDPSIFLYGEDVDLCARLLDAGWRLALVPGARAGHSIGGSQRPESTRWLDGLDTFLVRRGVPRWRRAVAFVMIAVGLGARAMAAALGPRDQAGLAHRRRMVAGAIRALAIGLGRASPAEKRPAM